MAYYKVTAQTSSESKIESASISAPNKREAIKDFIRKYESSIDDRVDEIVIEKE